MAWRFRDDERNEKSVRALLRQPANRRCINCKSMGPQYVCLNYWTFICTICSGIHRELQHRVKSVSMSKFNAQEVTSLQNGGNESARKIYFRNWDPQRQPAPDSSNVEKLREFIKNVYVDGKYRGERQPSHAGGNDREESIKGHRADIHRSSSKSLPYDGRYDDRPASAATSQSDSRLNYRGHFDHTGQHEKSTPGQVEDDRRSWERPYRQNYSENEQRPSEHNSNESRDWEASPVKEKLGDNVPSTLVENGGSHANGDRDSEKMWRSMDARGQKFGSSSSFGSFDANRPGHQSTTSDSLIDLSIESSESSSVSGVPTSSDTESSGWANFDSFSASSHSGVSSISADSKSQKSESGQWEAQWNLPSANASPLMVSAADTWPPPQQLIPGNKSQDLFAPSFSVSGLTGIGQNADKQINMPPSQAHFASGGTVTQDLFAPSFSASGLASIGQNDDKQIHMPHSQARFASSGTVTQDLFAPSFSASGLAGIGQNAEKQIHMPSSQTRFASSGSVTQGQMTSFIEVKSTNPFDFPSDSLSLPSQNEFPNLDPLKAALPNFNAGPTFHSPAAGTLPQWSQFSATVSQPPVYHPSPAGGGSQQMMKSLPSSMHCMGPPVSGNFLNRTNTSMDGFYPNEGPSSRLVSARSLPTMASDSSFFTAQKLAFQNSSGISWFPDQSPVGQTGLYGVTNYSDPTFSAQRQQFSPQTHYFQQPPLQHQFPLQNQDFQGNSTNPFG